MKRVCLLVMMLCSPFLSVCFAQSLIDSIFQHLPKQNEQESLSTIRYLFSEALLNKIDKNKHDSLQQIFTERIEKEIVEKETLPTFLKAIALIQIGSYYLFQQKEEKGIIYLERAKLVSQSNNKRVLQFLYEKHATYYQNHHRLDSALVYAVKEMEIAKEIGDETLLFDASYRLGGVLYDIQDYTQAREYLRYTAYHNLKGKDFLRTLYNTIALSFQKQAVKEGKKIYFDSARVYYDTAYHYALLFPKDIFWRGIIRGNIGDSYFYEGNYKKAIPYLLEDLKSSMLVHNNKISDNAMITMNRLTATYIHLGKMDSATLFKDSLEKKLSKEKRPSMVKEFYQVSALYYKKKGDFSNAFKFLDRYLVFSDSINKVENILEANKLDKQYMRYQRAKIEQELAQQKEDNLRKNMILFVISFISVLLLGLIYALYNVNKDKIKANNLLNLQKTDIFTKNEELNQINEELKNTLELVAKQKEAITHQATKLQDLNQLKDKLFSIISHDLRSPLGAMKGVLAILEMGGLSEVEMQIITKDIKRRLDSLDYALNNLLVWSREQMSGQESHKEMIELRPLIHGKFNLYSINAEAKKITLINSVPEDTFVRADLNHLRVVLRNLLGNAIKFTPEDGQIEVIAITDNESVKVGVRDSGVGMTAEHIAKLFNSNTHFTTRGTKDEKGTGLGLLLCKEFVEKDGGKIWVESTLNEGSTFWIELPKT